MTRQQVQELIATGESQTIEFKRRFSSPEKIARELCAFANTDGGYLLIGVDDDGKVIGVASEKQEIELIELACSLYIRPPLNAEVWVVSLTARMSWLSPSRPARYARTAWWYPAQSSAGRYSSATATNPSLPAVRWCTCSVANAPTPLRCGCGLVHTSARCSASWRQTDASPSPSSPAW